MVGAGVYLGIAFETFSRLRLKKNYKLLTISQDLLFWIVQVAIIFLWLQYVNHGEMRVHVLLSLMCGYAMYKALLETFYKRILERVIRSVVYIYRTIVKAVQIFIIRPAIWLYQVTVALVLFLFGIILKCGHILYSILLFFSRPFSRIFLGFKKRITKKRLEKEKEKSEKKTSGKKGIFTRVANWLFKKKS